LEIAGQIDAAKDLHDLKTLLREGRMKEFYETANRYMRIKRSNPVVTKIKRSSDGGEVEILEERIHVEKAISDYFSDIYKRPEHMVPDTDNDMEDEAPVQPRSSEGGGASFAGGWVEVLDVDFGVVAEVSPRGEGKDVSKRCDNDFEMVGGGDDAVE
jgi:hypothetical protein